MSIASFAGLVRHYCWPMVLRRRLPFHSITGTVASMIRHIVDASYLIALFNRWLLCTTNYTTCSILHLFLIFLLIHTQFDDYHHHLFTFLWWRSVRTSKHNETTNANERCRQFGRFVRWRQWWLLSLVYIWSTLDYLNWAVKVKTSSPNSVEKSRDELIE